MCTQTIYELSQEVERLLLFSWNSHSKLPPCMSGFPPVVVGRRKG